ncbi:SLC13 family permease [Paenibacillus antri]|nr:SLC13 family permease [Paenibacillus antri]
MHITDIRMFAGLSKMELAKLLGKLERRRLAPGELLFEQGDPGGSLFLIERGAIELFSGAEDARRSLAVLAEGDSLGEMAALTGEARTATAIASTECFLYEIDRDTLDRLIEEHPAISSYFIRLLSERLTATNARLQASKESRAAWIASELQAMGEAEASFLLWCASFPIATEELAASVFPTMAEMDESRWRTFLRVETVPEGGRRRFRVRPAYQGALSDAAVERVGLAAKREWIERAMRHYEAADDWIPLLALYEAEGEASRIVDAIRRWARAGRESTEEEEAAFHALRGVPRPTLTADAELLTTFLSLCREREPELGLELLEEALDRGEGLSAAERASLCEQGAGLARVLQRHRLALDYLRLAEAGSGDARQEYELAKLQASSRKSRLLTERASRFVKATQWNAALTIALAIACIAISFLLPPVAGLSREGMGFIGIGIAAVLLWIVNIVPDYVVALGMAMLWATFGLVEPEVALSGFGSETWLYMVFIMALSAVVTRSGILYRFSLHALKRFPSSYRGQAWGIVAGGLLLNPLIPSSSAKVSLGVPIARTISESMGFKDRSDGAAGLGLTAMTFYGFTAPFVLTGSYTNAMAYGLVESAAPVGWLDWALYALPAGIVFTAILFGGVSLSFRGVRAAKSVSADVLNEQLRLLGPLSARERDALIAVVGAIVLMVLQPLHGLANVWILLLAFAYTIIRGALDRQTLLTGIDWSFLLFLGVAFSFAAAASRLGVVDALTGALGEGMGAFAASPAIFLAAVALLSFAVTLVIRDDPAVILLVVALLPLAEQAGVHPWVLVFVVLLSTDPFFFTYQSPTYLTAYFSSEEASFSHRQGRRVGLLYGLTVLAIAVLCVPYWRWLGLIW